MWPALQCDPIEKKPFFHAWPGALAYSFGMLGCDLHCAYCQNWVTSQALRDPQAVAPPRDVDPEDLAADAVRQGARVVVSTYNEPLITVEWAVEVFKAARAKGLATGFVSNGNGTSQVLDYLTPWIDLYKVDLEELRRQAVPQARRTAAADSRHHSRAARARALGRDRDAADFGLQRLGRAEITTLTEFIASVSPDIPWHVTAFHQDYRMRDPLDTTPQQLQRRGRHRPACRAALRLCRQPARPGRRPRRHTLRVVSDACSIARFGYHIREYHVTADGTCPTCHTRDARPLGSRLCRPNHFASVPAA